MTTAIVPYSKQMPLSRQRKNKDKFTTVSYWWYEFLNQWNWSLDRNGYALCRQVINKKTMRIYLHRFILHIVNQNLCADHIDRNRLNNCNHNLRVATIAENNRNQPSRKNSTSTFLGVSYCTTRNKWVAQIKHNKVPMHIGRFNTEKEAALAYDDRAKELHGEFANLNFK